MINTSRAYKEAIAGNSGNREFCIADQITFANGTQVPLSLEDVIAYSINDATSESGKFQIGAAIIKEYSITLNNFDAKFDDYNFDGADVTADIGLKLADGTWEILRKGTFRIVQAKETEKTINVTAYDNMLFFDRPYSESTLAYPATITQIVEDACMCCQMTFDASTIEMGDYIVQERPADEALTFRDVISYAAQIMGCYARIDRLGKLQFGWYSFENDVNIWGGIFDGDMPYSTGDDLDGGTFSPWNTGDVYSAGFESMADYHHLYDLKTKSINTDDIVITGVQVYAQTEGAETLASNYGEDGYVIVIESNPLIQSTADTQTVARHVGEKLVYSCFRPMSITARSDPSIEAGDTAIVTISALKPSTHTIITNTTFSIGGAQKIECSAETPTEKTYTKYSAQTRIIARMNKETEAKLNVYEIAVQQMNQLAANTMGFFATTVKQTDGSILAYRHDKPQLSESKVVYKSGIDGFWVTQEYQGTDAATTAAGKWKSGLDSNGNATLNMLSVIGINFNWAHGGTLTLGGAGNGNGLLVILDASNKQIGYIDKDGVHFEEGEFKGTVNAGKVMGSEISGSVIKTYSPDEYVGMEMEEGVLNFFYGGIKFAGMYAESDSIIDENTGTEEETKYVVFDCGIMADGNYYESDERKKDIEAWSNAYDDFIMDILPIQYTWKDRRDGRTHVGIGARTTKELLKKHGITNSALVLGNEEKGYRVAYHELHGMEIASIQKSRAMIDRLEKRVQQLESQLMKGDE